MVESTPAWLSSAARPRTQSSSAAISARLWSNPAATVRAGELSKCHQRVRHANDGRLTMGKDVVRDNEHRRPGGERRMQVLVTVELLALQRDEHVAGLKATRICVDTDGRVESSAAGELSTGDREDLIDGETGLVWGRNRCHVRPRLW